MNLLVGAVGAAVLGLKWPIVGIGAFAVAVVLVALQDYLVPGTPELTARYLPDQIHQWFVHDETAFTAAAPDEEELNVERLLVERGILRPCDDGDDLCLEADFARSWRRTAVGIGPGLHAGTAAPVVAVDPATVSVIHGRNGVYLEGEDYRYQWISRGALLADVAADQVFTDRVSEWSTLPVAHRLTVLRGLRAFPDVCPLCDGTVRIGNRCGSVLLPVHGGHRRRLRGTVRGTRYRDSMRGGTRPMPAHRVMVSMPRPVDGPGGSYPSSSPIWKRRTPDR